MFRQYSTLTPLTGKYKEYDFNAGKYKNPVQFRYAERTGFTEVVVEGMTDLEVNSRNLSMESFDILPFKSQDKVFDQEGNEYLITSIIIEPDTNPYRQSFADRRKYQKKILFVE